MSLIDLFIACYFLIIYNLILYIKITFFICFYGFQTFTLDGPIHFFYRIAINLCNSPRKISRKRFLEIEAVWKI